MKNKHLESVIEGLKKVKYTKFEDKKLRTNIFQVFMALLGAKKSYDDRFENLKTAFLSAHKKEQEVVNGLQQKLNLETNREKAAALLAEIESHVDYKQAVDQLNEQIMKLGNEDVKLKSIDMDKFMEEYQKQEDFELSVVEAIYPLYEQPEAPAKARK